MRILHCLHASPLDRAAGVEVYTSALAHALSEQHDVALLVPARRGRGGTTPRTIRRIHHFELARHRPPHTFVSTYRNTAAHEEIERVFDQFRPDVVHVQHLMGLSSELPALARARGISVVMTLHDYWLACAAGGQQFHRERGLCAEPSVGRCADCTAHLSGPALRARNLASRLEFQLRPSGGGEGAARRRRPDGTGWSDWLAKTAGQLATRIARVSTAVQEERILERWETTRAIGPEVDRFIAPSHFMRDEMVRFGLPSEKLVHVEHGISDDHRGEKRRLPSAARHFGYLGGITRHKGVHNLIDAVNQLPDGARLTIWGDLADDPAYANALRGQATHPGIEFAGRVDPTQVPERLREIDCLVVPSLWYENAPLVILEAISAGIAVVASRRGGNGEQLASGGGLLYDPDDPRELTACLKRLMDEPGLIRNLVEKQPPVKSIGAHAEEVAAIYRDVLADHRH